MARRQMELALAGIPRVDLMPRTETHRRERLSLGRVWSIVAIGALVLALLGIAGTFLLRAGAEQALAAEQARAATLTGELASHSDVSRALADQAALQSYRGAAMSNDFAWTPLLTSVTSALPKGVSLSEFALAPGTAAIGDDPAVEVGASGTLTFESAFATDQAATVAALAAVAGVRVVDAAALTSAGQDSYQFIVTIAFDQTIYSGDYAVETEQ